MAPFIYINGYPGVGKLTVAKELCKLIPKSKVFDNHLLIDSAAAIFERTAKEYQHLRQVLRREALKSIASTESAREVTYIFTDQQSSSENGISAVKDYEKAVAACNSPFSSIILQCEIEEDFERAQGGYRGTVANNTKLINLEVLRSIREREDIFHFRNEYEPELDVTELSPITAASIIYSHIYEVRGTLSARD